MLRSSVLGFPIISTALTTFPERGSKFCLKPHQSDHLRLASFRVSPANVPETFLLWGLDGLLAAHRLYPALSCSASSSDHHSTAAGDSQGFLPLFWEVVLRWTTTVTSIFGLCLRYCSSFLILSPILD